MRIAVTGGTGFIGSWVVRDLLQAGHSVKVLARNPGKVPGMQAVPSLELVPGDLADLASLDAFLIGAEAVVHLALGWGESPESMLMADTLPTVHLMEKADALGIPCFLYTSSTAAMGDLRPSMAESMANLPHDLYGATKAASEAYVLGFAGRLRAQGRGMRCNVIRPGYVFGNPAFAGGPVQPDRRFHEIVAKAKRQENIHLIKNDGTQFICAADIAKVYRALLESSLDRQVVLALASRWVSWERIAQEAVALVGSSSRIVLEDKGWGDEPILFSVERMHDLLGFDFCSEAAISEHLRYLVGIDG